MGDFLVFYMDYFYWDYTNTSHLLVEIDDLPMIAELFLTLLFYIIIVGTIVATVIISFSFL
jgi:hypothetical protein